MGHAAYRRKALDVLFPTIPVKRGMLSANREFHVVAGVVIFPTHPGSRINLLRAGKTLRAKALAARRRLREEKRVREEKFYSQRVFSQILSQFARVFDLAPDVGFRRSWYRRKACAAYFCKVPDLRKSELGLVRYGPANRGHRSVFGPFEGSFPIGIPARPGKFLAIREFLVVHGMCLLSNVPGLADQLVASQEDSARKRGNVGGKIPELSAKPYFVGLFSRAWPCTEASLGSQDMILRTGGRRNVPYAKGSSSD
uniref:Uncharacterized protein n=1 Tax=Fagus sylvatica TaxID=28930 RepID=A0A2N9FM33_FAGSY